MKILAVRRWLPLTALALYGLPPSAPATAAAFFGLGTTPTMGHSRAPTVSNPGHLTIVSTACAVVPSYSSPCEPFLWGGGRANEWF